MRIDVTDKKGLYVHEWSTSEPMEAVRKIEQQLAAAKVVWGCLEDYKIVKRKRK